MSDESAEAFARRLERETAEQFNQGKAPPKPRAKKASKKAIEATESAIFEALRTNASLHSGAMFRLDTFAGQIRVMHPIPVKGLTTPAWKPNFLTDIEINHMIVWLQDNGYVKVSAGKVQRAVEMEAHRNQYSSALEALQALPPWDGTVRMDKFWSEVCGAPTFEEGMDDDAVMQKARYLAAVGRSFFISIVARIKKPGCKVDHVPVLEGIQGLKKSMLLAILAFDNPEWFSDSMSADIANKDAKAHLAGKLIVEMAEMHQMKASAIEALKRFITSATDKFRPSYGRNEVVQARQCVFVGTTNSVDYFKDHTGNRRFWPISCVAIDIDKARQWMPQIYAEALVAFEAREQWWLTPEMEAVAEIEQNERLTDDPWESAVNTAIEDARSRAIGARTGTFWVTTETCLERINPDKGTWDHAKQQRIHVILKKKGGENRRLPRDGNTQKRGWRFVTSSNGAYQASHTSHEEGLTH